MDDVATAHNENENLKKIRSRLMQWEAKQQPLAALNVEQEEYLDVLTNIWRELDAEPITAAAKNDSSGKEHSAKSVNDALSETYYELQSLPAPGISATNDFLCWYDRVSTEMLEQEDMVYIKYLQQLETRSAECQKMLTKIAAAIEKLDSLSKEYEFVSNKTSSLNEASEQLTQEQQKLQQLGDEIQRRLHYFNQVDQLNQRLQSPTLSVASDTFRDCLNRLDDCLEYLRDNPKFKDAAGYTVKYKHCLSKAVTLMKNYANTVIMQATANTLHTNRTPATPTTPTPTTAAAAAAATNDDDISNSPDAAFALYYGKYQTSAAKIKRISQLVESRIHVSGEYEQLLMEIQQTYLTERAAIMSPAVDKAIKNLKMTHKTDHCSLMRSTCAFLVHVCQDEQRLYFQFFSTGSEQLTAYLEGLCTILYDTMRPFIIHINHLETLAEICSILRIEMLEEHVQQNPEALEAFANTVNQLLQDAQERLVFRAHLYLQSDILHYNPSAGDLAYPDKLEMMESIAISLQEPQFLRRSDSRSSLISEAESVDTAYSSYSRRQINSPADMHGMWYPTVRRTLVCLSRLYRCVDRPIFQGLSQEALKLCIQSVSTAAKKISATKTNIDGELFEIKHLLILREQIAPFRVDFTVKETSLDFSKVKTAAFGLLQKRKQLFSMGSNNALLEFLLEGTPQIKEHLLDSRKEVDRQLKTVCEQFIKDAVQMLVGPIIEFLDKAQALLANETKNTKESTTTTTSATATTPVTATKVNYALRAWASPQQISGTIQETQRLIKSKLASLQRSMQLYLSNRDTEFIIFRPIRNNIIQTFVKLEQILSGNGYTTDDMIITSCPTAEQVSILLSSANILATEGVVNFSAAAATRKISCSSNEPTTTSHTMARQMSSSSDVANESKTSERTEKITEATLTTTTAETSTTNTATVMRKISIEKRVSFEESGAANAVNTNAAAAAGAVLQTTTTVDVHEALEKQDPAVSLTVAAVEPEAQETCARDDS